MTYDQWKLASPYDDDASQYQDEDAWYAQTHDEEGNYIEYEPPPAPKRKPRDSARRRKKFAQAEGVLRTQAALSSERLRFIEGWSTRSGRKAGLYVTLGPDHEIVWTPRGGYSIRPIDPIPF